MPSLAGKGTDFAVRVVLKLYCRFESDEFSFLTLSAAQPPKRESTREGFRIELQCITYVTEVDS